MLTGAGVQFRRLRWMTVSTRQNRRCQWKRGLYFMNR